MGAAHLDPSTIPQPLPNHQHLFFQSLDGSFSCRMGLAVAHPGVLENRWLPALLHLFLRTPERWLPITIQDDIMVYQLRKILDELMGSMLIGKSLLRDDMDEEHVRAAFAYDSYSQRSHFGSRESLAQWMMTPASNRPCAPPRAARARRS